MEFISAYQSLNLQLSVITLNLSHFIAKTTLASLINENVG